MCTRGRGMPTCGPGPGASVLLPSAPCLHAKPRPATPLHTSVQCCSRFKDGFPNLFVRDAIRVRNRHVAFLASFHDPSVIFEQISIIYSLPRLFVGSFTLVLPYFPTGTAERVEAEGDVATAFTLARIISNTPLARGGPASVVIFDIHALQERFYFGDHVLPLFESGIPLLRDRLQTLGDSDAVTIAYPDEGAWKRFHYQFGDYPEVICTKVRNGDQRIVQLKEGEPQGRHVVIVDDLVQSGEGKGGDEGEEEAARMKSKEQMPILGGVCDRTGSAHRAKSPRRLQR